MKAHLSRLLLVPILVLMACTAKNPQNSENPAELITSPTEISKQVAKLSPEESKEMASEVGKNWLYGDGFGATILNVGATIAFPPYGALVLTNIALSASGYETLGVGSALDKDSKKAWDRAYSSVVSGPGRVVAGIAGEEYRGTEIAKKKIEKYLALSNTDPVNDEY